MSWPAVSIIASMRTAPLVEAPAERPVAREKTVSASHTRQIWSGG